MRNLNVNFCGVDFVNPFTVAASPSSDSRDKVERALEKGWGGIVFKTTSLPEYSPSLAKPYMAGLPFMGKPQSAFYNIDLISERTIYEIQQDITYFKSQYPDRILIGSIMASRYEDWVKLVECLEDAGADMIECSMSCPQGEHSIRGDSQQASNNIPAANRQLMKETTKSIKDSIRKKTPLIVKLTPNVTDIIDIALGASEGGADAVCAIDTVRGFIGIDLDTGYPRLNNNGYSTWGGLSGPAIKPIAMGCISKIAKVLSIPVAGVGGISTWQDAAEFILLGAKNIQVCTAISRYGFGMVEDLCKGLSGYIEQRNYESIEVMAGQSLKYILDHSQLDLNNKVLCTIDEKTCIRCGSCVRACWDAGFGALSQDKGLFPQINKDICPGCGVCQSVCAKNSITLQ